MDDDIYLLVIEGKIELEKHHLEMSLELIKKWLLDTKTKLFAQAIIVANSYEEFNENKFEFQIDLKRRISFHTWDHLN